jgi:hypothetical protein
VVRKIALISLWLLLPTVVLAQKSIVGRVINATTGRPAAGQKVELLALTEGMRATAEGQTGKDGSFTFSLKEAPVGPHILLRVFIVV